MSYRNNFVSKVKKIFSIIFQVIFNLFHRPLIQLEIISDKDILVFVNSSIISKELAHNCRVCVCVRERKIINVRQSAHKSLGGCVVVGAWQPQQHAASQQAGSLRFGTIS